MPDRLENHKDPKYRAKYQSLHYYVWDLGLADKELEVEEKFVFLAITDGDVDPLLNLMEMWCSLILQTLTENALQAYLLKGTLSPYAGGHLNVALPVHQSIQGDPIWDELSDDIYHSKDPSIQAYCASLRENYFNLKISPNTVLRELYKQKVRMSHLARAETSRQKSAQKSLEGRDVAVLCDKWRQRFSISHWNIGISRKVVHLDHGAILYVNCDLVPGRHPNCYAELSQKTDPSTRLGIHLKGTDKFGNSFNI